MIDFLAHADWTPLGVFILAALALLAYIMREQRLLAQATKREKSLNNLALHRCNQNLINSLVHVRRNIETTVSDKALWKEACLLDIDKALDRGRFKPYVKRKNDDER